MARQADREKGKLHRQLGRGPEERAGMRQLDEQVRLKGGLSVEAEPVLQVGPVAVQPAVRGQVRHQRVRRGTVPSSEP